MSMNNRRHSFDANDAEDKKTNWSFPLMKMGDIKDCLNALDVKVTEAQLNDISANKALYREIMEYLAELCTGVTKEEMAQPAFNGLSALNNPELHDDSIPTMHAFKAVGKMMQICGVMDFSIKDMLAPNPKRMRRQLSGIINFAKFREERFALLQDVSTEREKLVGRLTARKNEKQELENTLQQLREVGEQEEAAITAMEKEVSDIEGEIGALNNKQAEIREEIGELKSLNNSLKDGITARALQLEEAQSGKKKLQGQIVTSPERFRKQIIDVGQSLQTEQRDTKNAERKLRELAGWLTYVEEAQAQVGGALECMRSVRSEVEKQKAAVTEVEDSKATTASAREILSALDQNTQTVSRQAQRANDKLQHIRAQSQQRTSEGKQQVQMLHSEILEAENFGVQVRARAERAENEVARAEREYATESAAFGQEQEDMRATYRRLEGCVMQHLQRLQQAIAVDSTQPAPALSVV